MSTASSSRRPGRPRDPDADARIMRAALELAADGGLRGLRMEAVAARAGVGKATLYRRWSSKQTLLADAIRAAAREIDPPDFGSVREDYLALARQAAATLSRAAAGLMPRLLLETRDDPDLARIVRAVLVEPRRAAMREVLRRGVERGELRADLDPEVAIDVLIGPLIYRALLAGGYAEAVEASAEAVADAVLRGLAARS